MIKGIPSDCLDSQMKFTNLEAQHKDNPDYPLVSRAIYYCSRLLSKQKNAPDGFQHSDYDKIKKGILFGSVSSMLGKRIMPPRYTPLLKSSKKTLPSNE